MYSLSRCLKAGTLFESVVMEELLFEMATAHHEKPCND
jgi:hypothetical protein